MSHDSPLDVFVLLIMFVAVFLIAAIFAPRGLVAWAREEWRLFKLDTWNDGRYNADRQLPCTASDPDVRRMVARQIAFGERLRRDGRSLLAGRHYTPVLTKAPEAPPPRADKVIPIRRPVHIAEERKAT